ncbi:hypothetical protein BG015_001970 [Linnemannia schmuckeri]|uniref:F-box domain-containing protein n=1 Tax=Linnemannia schmuckeri TaxID=64567 RepID=A0A9P5RPK5_9FUNG|nr:hypothetical protein BG015_001970 [Linnemannia schmuckeri]
MTDNSIGALVQFHRQRIASLLKRQEQQLRAQQSLSSLASSVNTTITSPLPASETFLTIPELVLTVLKFLPTKNLPQVCLVCNLWSALAQPILWRQDIRLESDFQIQAFATSVITHGAWVQSLDFSTRKDDEEGISLTHIDLTNIIPYTPRLRSIDVRDRTMDEHPLILLAPCSQLESIAFSQCQARILEFGVDDNRDFFSAWPQLKHLRISGTDKECISSASASLEKALVSSKSLHLETLELDFFRFWCPSTIHHLVRTNAGHLRHLDIATCKFSLLEFEKILARATQLESLGLHRCPYSVECLLRIAETHPQLKRLSLTDWFDFPIDVVTQVARACPLLEFLELEECGDMGIAARQFLAHCPRLRTLSLFPLEGPNVMNLFLGEPWVCQGLEEFRVEAIEYQPDEFPSAEARNRAIRAMWQQLAAQTRLQSLLLQFSLPKSGAKVLHPDGDFRNSPQSKKNRILLDDGLHQLGALKRLKHLGVIGYSTWDFADVEWMARSFPWLELFWYHRDDMTVPQWSWLRTHRPEIELIPNL